MPSIFMKYWLDFVIHEKIDTLVKLNLIDIIFQNVRFASLFTRDAESDNLIHSTAPRRYGINFFLVSNSEPAKKSPAKQDILNTGLLLLTTKGLKKCW